MPFTLHHSSSLTQIISTSDAKLDVAINTPCSPSLLLIDSNLFQEKVIKNKEETLVSKHSVVIWEGGKRGPQLSLETFKELLLHLVEMEAKLSQDLERNQQVNQLHVVYKLV